MISRLLAFMLERHQIYLRRMSGQPWPWTADPILQQYKFTNVYRELDRVTAWIRTHWREPYADSPNLWFAMALARQINWPETLAEIDFPVTWDPKRVLKVLRARRARGDKVYTGAYMLRCDIQGPEGGDKPFYTVMRVLQPVWERNQHANIWRGDGDLRTIEQVTKWFMLNHGWGGFLSYEVATDLRHTRYLRHAPDINTWANAGPGALRGLNRVHGRPLKAPSSDVQALEEMRWLLRELQQQWPPSWQALELRDIEHSLCEFDKYERTRLGQGRPRSTYAPPSAIESAS